jgi:hypothetical protein
MDAPTISFFVDVLDWAATPIREHPAIVHTQPVWPTGGDLAAIETGLCRPMPRNTSRNPGWDQPS